jgi:sugar diacid utilization regulator
LSPQDAELLLNERVLNERLKLHMRQVGKLMHNWLKEKEQFAEQGQWLANGGLTVIAC